MKYIDTSVIVSALDPLDEKQKTSLQFLEEEKEKVASELVMLELASVVSRRLDELSIPLREFSLPSEQLLIAILVYVLRRFGIKFVKIVGSMEIPLLGQMSLPVAATIELSAKIKLRSLDLLHIAYVKLLKEKGFKISAFATLDEYFVKAKEFLEEELSVALETL
nr:PIN domain-containing protein [Candidatus Freyrarchaeum guaymaensis]